MLDRIRLVFSCDESWDRMRGDDRARFCDRCQKMVYNLSEMTTAEAESTVCGPGSPPCVRYARMADGRVRTADRVLPRLALTASLAMAAAGAALLAGEEPPRPLCVEPGGPVMLRGEPGIPEMGDIAEPIVVGEYEVLPPEPIEVVRAGGIRPMPREMVMGGAIAVDPRAERMGERAVPDGD